MTSNTETQLEMDFFFWLGADGETEMVDEAEFLNRQNKIRIDRDNFLNVRINTSDEGYTTLDG